MNSFVILKRDVIYLQYICALFFSLNFLTLKSSYYFSFQNFYIKIWFKNKENFFKLPLKFIFTNKNYFFYFNFLQNQTLVKRYNYIFISKYVLINKNNTNFILKPLNFLCATPLNLVFFLLTYNFIKNLFFFFNFYNVNFSFFFFNKTLFNYSTKIFHFEQIFKILPSFIRFKKNFNLINFNAYLI